MVNNDKSKIPPPIGGWLLYSLYLLLLLVWGLYFVGYLNGLVAIICGIAIFILYGYLKMRRFFGGFDFINLLADEIGIERQLFGSALTEVGVNYAFLKIEAKTLMEKGASEEEAIQTLASKNAISVSSGLRKLEQKFPDEQSIPDARDNLQSYLLRRGIVLPN